MCCSFHIFSFALCCKETPHIFFLKNSKTILGCFGGKWENLFDIFERNKALFQSSLGQRHLSIPILIVDRPIICISDSYLLTDKYKRHPHHPQVNKICGSDLLAASSHLQHDCLAIKHQPAFSLYQMG